MRVRTSSLVPILVLLGGFVYLQPVSVERANSAARDESAVPRGDTLRGGAENDVLWGGEADDLLVGAAAIRDSSYPPSG